MMFSSSRGLAQISSRCGCGRMKFERARHDRQRIAAGVCDASPTPLRLGRISKGHPMQVRGLGPGLLPCFVAGGCLPDLPLSRRQAWSTLSQFDFFYEAPPGKQDVPEKLISVTTALRYLFEFRTTRRESKSELSQRVPAALHGMNSKGLAFFIEERRSRRRVGNRSHPMRIWVSAFVPTFAPFRPAVKEKIKFAQSCFGEDRDSKRFSTPRF